MIRIFFSQSIYVIYKYPEADETKSPQMNLNMNNALTWHWKKAVLHFEKDSSTDRLLRKRHVETLGDAHRRLFK